jgi:hypothetical protein
MVITPKYFSKWKATINKSLNQIEENFWEVFFFNRNQIVCNTLAKLKPGLAEIF